MEIAFNPERMRASSACICPNVNWHSDTQNNNTSTPKPPNPPSRRHPPLSAELTTVVVVVVCTRRWATREMKTRAAFRQSSENCRRWTTGLSARAFASLVGERSCVVFVRFVYRSICEAGVWVRMVCTASVSEEQCHRFSLRRRRRCFVSQPSAGRV